MSQSTNKPSKRLDLQGIRALAIIVVLGFHFYPQHVPNGYLGVDQFFVLSGFLMCMLLKRAEGEAPCSLVSLFYSKRFKRILPLYLLVILLSLVALYNFFPDTAIETNQESASRALLFVSNRPKTVQEDYFQMLSIAVDIFTHTWSLSVEIQFYFLVPMMFLIGRMMSVKIQYLYYGVLGCISYSFYLYASPTVAFNSVFARIWQFLIGMVVYLATISKTELQYNLLQSDEEEGLSEKLLDDEDAEECCPNETLRTLAKFSQPATIVSLTCLLLITFCPFTLPAFFVRPFVTFCTGFLMFVSEDNKVLSNRALTYIGDISYSLYLIHWPIYAYWKLMGNGNQIELALSLLAAVILAVITYETFEKWYLHLSSTSIGTLVVILFVLNVVVINKDEIWDQIERSERNVSRLDGLTDNMTMDDATNYNYRWSVNDQKNLFTNTCVYEGRNTPLGWCRHTGLSPNAPYRIATIGNSWTANHAKLFYQECGYQAKSILQGSAYGCEPLYPSANSKLCTANFTDFEEHIRKEKPDYAFIFTRYMSIGGPFPKNVTEFKDDPIYQIMKNQTMKMLANINKKLYILDALPRLNVKYITKITTLLKSEEDPLEIDKLLVNPHQYEMARRRHAQLVKDCNGKCVMIDYLPEFYHNTTNTFRYFDEKGFSYFTTPSHMSPHGLELVRHIWRDVCSKL